MPGAHTRRGNGRTIRGVMIDTSPGRHVDLVQVRRHGVHILLVLLHILAKLLEQLHRLLLRLGGLLPTLTILSLTSTLYK